MATTQSLADDGGRGVRARRVVAGPVLLACLALAIHPAAAVTFVVSETRDAGDAAPGDGACEATPGAADCTLRAAVQEANALVGGDTVVVPAGRYALAIEGEAEEAAATGDLDVLDSIEIVGAGRDATVLDGAGLDRVLDVPRGSHAAELTLRDLTVRGGSHGGLRSLAEGAHVTLTDCAVTDNASLTAGGGIYAAHGALELRRTLVAANHAAMQADAIRIHGGTLDLFDSRVAGTCRASADDDVTVQAPAIVATASQDIVYERSIVETCAASERLGAVAGATVAVLTR